jgi:hypothetical protein
MLWCMMSIGPSTFQWWQCGVNSQVSSQSTSSFRSKFLTKIIGCFM